MLRSRHLISGLVLAAVVAASALSGPAAAQTPPPGSYLETFDQYETTAPLNLVSHQPTSGNAIRTNTLDIAVHSRDPATWQGFTPMTISHGAHCEAPPATHASGTPMNPEDVAFICAANPHLMTAIHGVEGQSGYAAVYVTPNHLADFRQGEAVIRMDVSTFRETVRDWWDVTITPYEDNQPIPLMAWLPDGQGESKRGLRVRQGQNSGKTPFALDRIDNFVAADMGASCCAFFEDIPGFVPSASRRDTFELRISRTHVKFWMPQYGLVTIDKDIDDLGWDTGIVQIGHHSYSPYKQCNWGFTECGPITFHWDNIAISPSIPFTMMRANERAAFEQSQGQVQTFTFPAPAPPDSYLRVSASGGSYQFSTDNGTTWAPLRRQPSARNDVGRFEPFWQAIPAGTQTVQLRTTETGWWGLGGVEYAAIWSLQAQAPLPTPTGVPPTVPPTPTDIPTVTPAPTTNATATPLPPTSTATPTSAPVQATATSGPQGNCSVTVAPNRKTGSWSCP